MQNLCIGLISGTSLDGVDAVLAEFGDRSVTLVEKLALDYPADLERRLRRAIENPDATGLDELGELHASVGQVFAGAAGRLLAKAGLQAEAIRAIGSHGQTLRHRPDANPAFTLQIGDPARIAVATGITTVADFRSNDVALGGQGAPLVPPFHAWLLRRPGEARVVLNLGGIANVTILDGGDDAVTGHDTGPGNTLLDAWARTRRGWPYDEGGRWAAGGTVDRALLERLLADPYLTREAPKSTGFEYFNLPWLEAQLPQDIADQDVQATLAEFTARSVADAIGAAAPGARKLICCGGGAHNGDLLRRLAALLPEVDVTTSADFGLEPDWVEATAFAWLATRRLDNLAGNLPAVTGAAHETRLGAIYAP